MAIARIAAMRDLALTLFIFGGLLATLRYPFMGVLLWAWFVLATPQQAAHLADQLPLNMIIAAGAIGAFAIHGEFRRFRPTPLVWLVSAFTGWLCVSQWMSLAPDISSVYFDRLWKIMAFVLLCLATVTDRLRFHALLFTLVLVMAFFGLKGGAFTVMTGGQFLYFGLENTVLYDNNHMGIALAATLPLMLYAARWIAVRPVRFALYVAIALSYVAIVGTQSRGAFVSMLVLAGFYWWYSRHKVVLALAGLVVGIAGLATVSDAYLDRMSTITDAAEDESFQGRIDAWVINWELAAQNPVTGAGLRTAYEEEVAATVSDREPRAAHSIYFEILGGTGFVGLALYLAMFAYSWIAAGRILKDAGIPGSSWRGDFARYARMSLATFAVGAASVSMEMWEGYLIVFVLIEALRRLPETALTATSEPLTPKERIRKRAGRRPMRQPA